MALHILPGRWPLLLTALLSSPGCAAMHAAGLPDSRHPLSAMAPVLAVLLLSGLSAGLVYAVLRRRRAEKVLRQSREKYRTLVENTPDLIVRADSGGRLLYVGPAIKDFFGVTADRVLGKNLSEIRISDELLDYYRENLRKVFDTKAMVESEMVFRSPAGPRVFNWRLIPERNGQGEFTTVLAIFRDITDHRKAERDYKALFNSMLSAFCLLETSRNEAGEHLPCRFVDVNPAFERCFGVERKDIAGESVERVFGEVSPHWIRDFVSVAETGRPMNFENFTAGGSRFFSGYAYSPAPGSFACVFNEITEKKQAEEENQRLSAQLDQARKMEAVGRLAGGVAHDFNNLLTVILGHMELVLEGPADIRGETRESLSQVRLAARRASDLTRQLLAYGRRQTLSMKPMDVNSVIRNFSTMLDRLAGEGITISLKLASDLEPVRGDRGQIEQVLVNLTMNSRDAMPEGGGISIETESVSAEGSDPEIPAGNYAAISFSDTGHGMDEQVLNQVFEPFFTTKELGRGRGLGLASVHGIIKQHGGAIKVESRTGGGATFRIYLPRGEAAQAQAAPQTKSLPRGRETILLVEDEQAVRAVASRILQSLGYRVLEAGDASQALMIYGNGEGGFSLLLTDVVMPGMGGWALAEKLREKRPDIRVIFMSGHSDRLELPEGDFNFLEKPFSYRDLAEIVRTVLDSPEPAAMARNDAENAS